MTFAAGSKHVRPSYSAGTRYLCLIESCDWHFDRPLNATRFVRPDKQTLAEHDGDYISATVSATYLADSAEVEAALSNHIMTKHSLMDFVAEVSRLKARVLELETADDE